MRYTTLLALFLSATSTIECGWHQMPMGKPIKYSIARYRHDFEEFSEEKVGSVLETINRAIHVKLEEDLTILKRGLLAIWAPTASFIASGKKIEEIEPGVFVHQWIQDNILLSGNLLTVIKKATFKNLEVLRIELHENRIKTLEPGAFENLPNLSVLTLYKNQIKDFYPNSLINTPNVYQIDFSWNQLQKLQEHHFEFMNKDLYARLDFSHNQIEEIHPNAFGKIHGFISLNLTGNKLEDLPGELFSRYRHAQLRIEDNELMCLPEEFFNSTETSEIHLKGNPFDCETISDLEQFQNINNVTVQLDDDSDCLDNGDSDFNIGVRDKSPIKTLINYSLEKTSDNFQNNTLQIINASVIENNETAIEIQLLGNVPVLRKGMFKITAELTSFNATERGVQEIEPGALDGQMIENRILLSGNLLTVIRRGTFKNLSTVSLLLHENNISTLEEGAFEDMPNLSVVTLHRNQIKDFYPNSFINTPYLFQVDLSLNKLQKLQENQFLFMNKDLMAWLSLSDNEITEIHPKAFGEFAGFSTLNLTGNKLTSLPKEMFLNYSHAQTHIENNMLTTLPDAFFTVTEIFEIFLRGNKFECPTLFKLKDFQDSTGYNLAFDDNDDCNLNSNISVIGDLSTYLNSTGY